MNPQNGPKKDSPFQMLVNEAINNVNKSTLKPETEKPFGSPRPAIRPGRELAVPAERNSFGSPPSIHELAEARAAKKSSQEGGDKVSRIIDEEFEKFKQNVLKRLKE
ncbi:MAG: hypothetical protein GOU97_03825 [Nanoarchaeota archaeon]|nr:hypothetical protein [Nanoarchaeota archaeon]